MNQRLIDLERGKIRRLIVEMPPRHGKSQLVSHWFPVWLLSLHPDWPIMLASYEADFASSWGRQVRNTVQEHMGALGVQVVADSRAVNRWQTKQGGGMITAGVGGPITGKGARVLIVDDPVKNSEEAMSLTYRDKVWDWWQSTAYTRLEPNGVAVLVMTRWNEDDLASRLLAQASQGGERWELLRLPAIAEAGDAIGRAEGAALWPERYDEQALEQIKANVGGYVWSALYQQRPAPAEGALFKREWFANSIIDRAPDGLLWDRYWDLAASTKTSADYTASAAVAFDGAGVLYIRDMVHGRWEWPDAYAIIKQTMLAEPKVQHGIEKSLHGIAAVQELMRDPDLRGITFRGIDVDRDKISRALPWQTRAEAGKVKLVRGEWVNGFLDEVTSFPYAAHDDRVDTVSGGVEMGASGGEIKAASRQVASFVRGKR